MAFFLVLEGESEVGLHVISVRNGLIGGRNLVVGVAVHFQVSIKSLLEALNCLIKLLDLLIHKSHIHVN